MNMFLSHPKLDVLYNPLLDDSVQKWIVQKFHLWMIYKHAQNHPKVDYTKHPISDDLETCSLSSKSGLYKSSKFG